MPSTQQDVETWLMDRAGVSESSCLNGWEKTKSQMQNAEGVRSVSKRRNTVPVVITGFDSLWGSLDSVDEVHPGVLSELQC